MRKTPLLPITNNTLEFTAGAVDHTLKLSKDLTVQVLELTAAVLKAFNFFPFNKMGGLVEALEAGAQAVKNSSEVTGNAIQLAIEKTEQAFKQAIDSVNIADQFVIRSVYDNKVTASILGSSLNSRISFSDIQMSIRSNNEDISVEQCFEDFKASGCKQLVVYLPGLFCDEYVWTKPVHREQQVVNDQVYLADHLKEKDFFPVIIRYNNGKPVPENGKELYQLLKLFLAQDDKIKLHVIAYSLGGLLLRSALYYAEREVNDWLFRERLKKLVLISSPDGGSYLEKIGYFLGHGLLISPPVLLKIIGFIGNMRSDGIKDLSHGVITRDKVSLFNWHLLRYFRSQYKGELDGSDVYQFYSVLYETETPNPIEKFFGDGVVELGSLSYLRERYFAEQTNPEKRVFEIKGENHFSVLDSKFLQEKIEVILTEA